MAFQHGSGAEKRQFPRVDLQAYLRCRLLNSSEKAAVPEQVGLDEPEIPAIVTEDSDYQCLAINLSTGGLGTEGDLTLMTDGTLAKGDDLSVEFELPDGRGLVRVVARVAWAYAGSDGHSMCGLYFVLMKRLDLDRIHDYVTQSLSKAA